MASFPLWAPSAPESPPDASRELSEQALPSPQSRVKAQSRERSVRPRALAADPTAMPPCPSSRPPKEAANETLPGLACGCFQDGRCGFSETSTSLRRRGRQRQPSPRPPGSSSVLGDVGAAVPC